MSENQFEPNAELSIFLLGAVGLANDERNRVGQHKVNTGLENARWRMD